MKLTKTQQLASTATGRNILVSAGAGTGKTRVLVERFLNFVIKGEASVTEMLALTFTEKAANEMKERVLQRLDELGLEGPRRELESAYISTIHSFAARMLREHPLEAGLDPEFRVIESEESDFLKTQAMDEVLESECFAGSASFELLKLYGETRIRESLFRFLDRARHEGKTLAQCIELSEQRDTGDEERKIPEEVAKLFRRLEEQTFLGEWEIFYEAPEWDWKRVEAFKKWRGTFTRKRGKKGDTAWPEIKQLTDFYLSLKIEVLARPWLEKFETLARAFESKYETLKKEKSMLDFDDLQIRALGLLRKEGGVYDHIRSTYRRKFRQILVDEFQDTDPLQLEFIELLASGNNLFFVGDYKQSIYRFRGAEPSLFRNKEAAYREREEGVWIPLSENFRTQEPVVQFINRFFDKLWEEEEESVPYEELIAEAPAESSSAIELLLIRPEEGETLESSRMREADQIAARILELHEEGEKYGDLAILFQAMTGVGLYEQALRKNGIPHYVLAGGGFYHQPEIKDMMSYLGFLENPRADIPLAASLRSPLFQISDDTLFWLSQLKDTEVKNSPLYEGLKFFENAEMIADEEKEKLRHFLLVSSDLLRHKDHLKLTELLDRILSRTSYELTVLADPQGIRKYANLRKLMNLAREFERKEPMPLSAFMRTVKQLELQEARESEARIEAEESGLVVRLMSIHRAKGLEFGTVFVADMGRKRQSPEGKTFLGAAGMGYALRAVNEVTGEEEQPAHWREIDEEMKKKDREEWKRLFYVACTRAKNNLIFSGVYSESKKEKNFFYDMTSWIEWLMASDLDGVKVIEGESEKKLRRERALAERVDLPRIFKGFHEQPLDKLIASEKDRARALAKTETVLKAIKPLERRAARAIDLPVSAYAAFEKNPADYWSVYELGYRDGDAEPVDRQMEAAAEDMSASDFGTAMHAVLEKVNFATEGIETLTGRVRSVFHGQDKKTVLEAEKIARDFYRSKLFGELRIAQKIYREIPFLLNERHGLIHGIVDVLFLDRESRWHVLDYKTAVGDLQKVENSGYLTQIEMYAHAVFKLIGEVPASGILYFLKNNWEHRVTWDDKTAKLTAERVRRLQDSVVEYRGIGPGPQEL